MASGCNENDQNDATKDIIFFTVAVDVLDLCANHVMQSRTARPSPIITIRLARLTNVKNIFRDVPWPKDALPMNSLSN